MTTLTIIAGVIVYVVFVLVLARSMGFGLNEPADKEAEKLTKNSNFTITGPYKRTWRSRTQ